MKRYYVSYPNGKSKALTFSYDDGMKHDRRLVELFNRYGLKGTFHLNGGLFPEETGNEERLSKYEVASLYEGHEVAAHTYTHPFISQCPIEKVAEEIIEDRKALEELVAYPVQGFSYPYGSYNDQIKSLLPALGIEYARVVGDSRHFNLPNDWYEWQATCHHNVDLMPLGKKFIEQRDNGYLSLMYVWGHSFEFEGDQNWELIEEFCEFISEYRDDIWFATNIEMKRYLEDAKRLVYSADGSRVYNPNGRTIWVKIDGQVLEIEPGHHQL